MRELLSGTACFLAPSVGRGENLSVKNYLLPLLLLTVGLSACWVERELPEYDLRETPFSNPYLDRSDATLTVEAAEGFTCPDGSTALIYIVSPISAGLSAPTAALFHGGNFDFVDVTGDHYENTDRLNGTWAVQQVRAVLGLETNSTSNESKGAWVAALVERGYRVAVPGNCWGDLWNGNGQGNYTSEGFLRLGSYLASETIQLLRNQGEGESPRVLAIGIAEGGRAITELARAGVQVDGVVVDASPDSLAHRITGQAVDQSFTDGLLAIYDYDVRSAENEQDRLELLRGALDRDSLAQQINSEGYRTPIFYAYSSLDERIRSESVLPAAEAIEANYPLDSYEIVDWEVAETAPSNHRLGRARTTLDWFDLVLPPIEESAPE